MKTPITKKAALVCLMPAIFIIGTLILLVIIFLSYVFRDLPSIAF